MASTSGPDGGGGPAGKGPGKARPDDDANLGNLLSYGLTIAIGALLGVLIGHWLDTREHWTPWGTLVGAVLGLSSGLYLLIRDALRMNRY